MIDIPKSTATVDVQLINTTTSIIIESAGFVQPVLHGHEFLHLPTFCFLIHHRQSERAVLFDCGARKNWRDLPPSIVGVVAEADIQVEKSVDEILVDGGYDLERLNSIIWSHWHWDHIGDASRFHSSTEIVVGPSFKANFMPGYPTRQEAVMLDTDFEYVNRGKKVLLRTCVLFLNQYRDASQLTIHYRNRVVREVDFTGGLQIGDFKAFDFFRDGSLYLLDIPGHAVGHIAALARTTEDTFVFMAGDTCHFPGTFRPSPQLTLPKTIPTKVNLDARFPKPCPSSCFMSVHRAPGQASSKAFYEISQEEGGWYVDPGTAQASVTSLEDFDGDSNILVLIAHDIALLEITELFPAHKINNWKDQGWKEKLAWSFLNELPSADGKSRRSFL